MVFLLQVTVLFQIPLTFVILVGGIGGRGGIETASAKNNQLISSQGPHWRASEASETLSGLFNRESRIYLLSESTVVLSM